VTTIEAANHLHRSILRLFRLMRATRPAKRIPILKLTVLGRLYRDGMATATELAAYLHVKPQSLTRLIADLEQHNLIIRRSNPEDRRQGLLEITEAGVQLLIEDVRDQRVKLSQIIAQELTPAEQELLRIAADLMDHIAEAIETQTAPLSKSKRKET
jgi:DNA-binding MarR family transcriptional regulator